MELWKHAGRCDHKKYIEELRAQIHTQNVWNQPQDGRVLLSCQEVAPRPPVGCIPLVRPSLIGMGNDGKASRTRRRSVRLLSFSKHLHKDVMGDYSPLFRFYLVCPTPCPDSGHRLSGS
jgi:hypothetical protein